MGGGLVCDGQRTVTQVTKINVGTYNKRAKISARTTPTMEKLLLTLFSANLTDWCSCQWMYSVNCLTHGHAPFNRAIFYTHVNTEVEIVFRELHV